MRDVQIMIKLRRTCARMYPRSLGCVLSSGSTGTPGDSHVVCHGRPPLTQLPPRTPRLQALNRVIEHVGLEDASPFTPDMVAGVQGYTGHYNRTLDPASAATMATLKRHFTHPSDDLQLLLDTYFPELEFQGLTSES